MAAAGLVSSRTPSLLRFVLLLLSIESQASLVLGGDVGIVFSPAPFLCHPRTHTLFFSCSISRLATADKLTFVTFPSSVSAFNQLVRHVPGTSPTLFGP